MRKLGISHQDIQKLTEEDINSIRLNVPQQFEEDVDMFVDMKVEIYNKRLNQRQKMIYEKVFNLL